MSEPSNLFDQERMEKEGKTTGEEQAESVPPRGVPLATPPVETLSKEQAKAATEEVVESAEEASGIRDYLVLVREQSGSWKEVEKVRASSQDSAIRSLGEDKLLDGATYVAPPVRSWRPTPVAVNRTTEIKIGQ